MTITAAPDDTIATLPATDTAKPSFGDIPLACIRASKTNPRKIFNDDDLNDLARSIKVQGVAQPILVRPVETIDGVTYFEIVAGERRFRASGLAGMPTVPAIVRELTDQAAYEIQVLENLQRVDLHPLEEAEGFEVMMAQYKVTADQLADKTGKSKAYIYASIKLCALEPGPRKAFYDGLLTKSTALLVARIPVKSLQVKCTEEITSSPRGVFATRVAADHIARHYMLNLTKATFDPEDLTLCKKAGACSVCPKRAGNQPIVFADVSADVCTDPVCFKAKGDAHGERAIQAAINAGRKVIIGNAAKTICPYHNGDIQGGYVNLDETNYNDIKRRTYREIIGDDAAKVALVLESPHDRSLLDVVKLSTIKDHLVKSGAGARAGATESSAREKEQEAAAKLEREYRSQLFMEIHHSTLMANLVDRDLRLIACQLFDRMPSNVKPTMLVMSLHGWDKEKLSYPDYAGKLRAAVDEFSPAQLNQFIRDCLLSRELEVYAYTSTERDEPANLTAYAERAKVDAKKIRNDILAAAKEKVESKLKAVDKKVAAAKSAPGKSTVPVGKDKKAAKPPAKKAGAKSPTPKSPKVARAVQQPLPIAGAAWPFPTSSGTAPATTGAAK